MLAANSTIEPNTYKYISLHKIRDNTLYTYLSFAHINDDNHTSCNLVKIDQSERVYETTITRPFV